MNRLLIVNVILVGIIIFLLLPYLETGKGENIANVINENPMAKQFLEEYPKAKVQGYLISRSAVEKEIEGIREDCGPDFEEQDYWKFQYTEQGENKTMVLWVDPETRETVCVIQNLLNNDVKIELGIEQFRKEIKVKKGQEFSETVCFYSVNGDYDYYVKVNVIESPDWRIDTKPMAHDYKPLGKDSVKMNVKVEPSELTMVEPEKHPPDESYIELEGLDGYVRCKPVSFTFYSPKPPAYKEYPSEKHQFSVNVTASYYRGMRNYYYDSWLLNYTIILV